MQIANRPVRGLVLGACLSACMAAVGVVSAQAVSMPLVPTSEFYFSEDARTSRPVVAIQGEGEALTEMLVKALARNPRAKAETAQLAHVAMAGGRPELGVELYDRLLRQIGPNDGLYRSVMWNYGWDLYRTGNHADALSRWDGLLKSRNVTADWMPVTFALALWTLDRRDEAVQWYAAAVRTEPGKWSSSDGFEALLPDWQPGERAILAQVQQVWETDPPQWR